jgi:hypothetical protein
MKRQVTKDNQLFLPCLTDSTQISPRQIISEVMVESEMNHSEVMRTLRTQTLYNFDYQNMTLNSRNISSNNINQYFTLDQNIVPTMMKKNDGVQLQTGYLNPMSERTDEFFSSGKLKEVYKYRNVLKCRCLGSFFRNGGDSFVVAAGSTKEQSYKKISGLWQAVLVQHIFSMKKYVNVLMMSKLTEMKDGGKNSGLA